MKRIPIFLFLCFQLIVVRAFGTDTATPIRWIVDTDRPAKYDIAIRRGETVLLEPQFMTYEEPMDLRDANTVTMRYRPPSMTNGAYYSVTGSVFSATSGVCRVRWTAANAATNNSYAYELAVSGSSGTVIRSYGTLALLSSITDNGTTNAAPRQMTSIDFATCDLLNVGMAPFLSSYDVSDLNAFNASLQNGTADIDVHGLHVRGPFTVDAWPADVVTQVVNSGTSGVTGRISRVDGTVYITFPLGGGGGGGGASWLRELLDVSITNLVQGDSLVYNAASGMWTNHPAEGEGLSTNRLFWVVNGETIGYVDTNGIVMLKGGLQLYEENLNCNVRAYDGSKAVPSITFYSSPSVGWYRKSYNGDYAWSFAHSSNDIAYFHGQGITGAGTNVLAFYRLRATAGYAVGATNGLTTNVTVSSGATTQTLHFVGGILLP